MPPQPDSSIAWTRLVPGTIDVLCLALVAPLLMLHATFTNDAWWHFALGKQMLADGAIPEVEVFSWTAAGEPLDMHSWLTDLVWALLERVGGLGLVEVSGVLVIALTFRLVYALARSLGASATFATLAVVGCAMTGNIFWILRPQLWTFLAFTWLFWAYVRYRSGEGRWLWWSPLLFVVWSNLHGGFMLGVAFLFGVGALEFVEARWRLDGDEATAARERARRLALLGLVGAVAACVHPSGPMHYVIALENTPLVTEFTTTINEWRAPNLGDIAWLEPTLLVSFVVLLAMRRWPPAFELGGFLASTHLALTVMRHVSLFGLIADPILAAWTTRVVADHRDDLTTRAPVLAGVATKLERIMGFGDQGPGGYVAILLAGLAAGIVVTLDPPDVLEAELIRDNYPVDAAKWIEAHDPPGPMFNSYPWGGFLVYRFGRERKVYVDSRMAPYRGVLDEYNTIYHADPDWRAALDRSGAAWLLIEKSAPLTPHLTAASDWVVAYTDETATIWVQERASTN